MFPMAILVAAYELTADILLVISQLALKER